MTIRTSNCVALNRHVVAMLAKDDGDFSSCLSCQLLLATGTVVMGRVFEASFRLSKKGGHMVSVMNT